MNRKRLTILRDFLANEVPDDNYYQGGYGYFEDDKLINACAAGWATQCRALQEEGLISSYPRSAPMRANFVWPKFGEQMGGYKTVVAFFGLTDAQFLKVFSASANISSYDKNETIRHIDELLAEGEGNA